MQKTSPLISVVIAAYNCSGFVKRAIDSVLMQDYPALEIIVSDDASTDDTREEILRLAADDGRIRLLCSKANRGPSAARNRGFSAAHGDWIAVLDADDEFAPGRLTKLVSAVQQVDSDAVVDGVFFRATVQQREPFDIGFEAPGKSLRLIPLEEFLERARPLAGGMDWGLMKPMFRASFLKSVALEYRTESQHGEDFLLFMDFLLASGRLLLVPEAGYIYTLRNPETSRTMVNYEAMRAQSKELLRDPRMQSRGSALSLLRRRIKAISIHEGMLEFDRLRASRSRAAVVLGVITSPRVAAAIAWRLQRKLFTAVRAQA